MKTFVMCAPRHFDVNYVINPWMVGNQHKINKAVAWEEWLALVAALSAAGAKVVQLEDCPEDCPDAVFTANAGLSFKGTFIPSYFRFYERAAEEEFFIPRFLSLGLRLKGMNVTESRELQSFEGAGDALYDRNKNIIWLGFGFRTALSFKPLLEDALSTFNVLIWPLELIDPNFYHLDTCFCPLDSGDLLWYPPAFSSQSQYTIKAMYPRAIEVTLEDARRFACNAVSVRDHLVLPLVSDALARQLEMRGLITRQVNMSQYLRSGGACKCLTIEIIE